MRRGFLNTSRAGGESSAAATASPAASTLIVQPPRAFNTSPSAHPSTLHWRFYPGTASPSIPTAHLALLIAATTAALLPSPSVLSLPASSVVPEDKLWEIKSVPGKGLGIVACKDIERGTILFKERPLLVYDPTPGRAPAADDLEPVLAHVLAYLRPEVRATILELSNAFPASAGRISGILKTNAYPCIAFPGDRWTYFGLFEIFSRLNHSCDPNTLPEFLEKELMLQIKAARRISRGEEITTTYVMTMQPRAQRREELRVKYHFECQCPWCSLGDAESAEKDAEREQAAKRFLAAHQQ